MMKVCAPRSKQLHNGKNARTYLDVSTSFTNRAWDIFQDRFWDENKCLLNCTPAGHPAAHPVPPLPLPPPPPPPPPLPPHHHGHHPPTVHQHHGGMHGFSHADFLHSAAVAAASEAGGGGGGAGGMDRNGLDGESPTF